MILCCCDSDTFPSNIDLTKSWILSLWIEKNNTLQNTTYFTLIFRMSLNTRVRVRAGESQNLIRHKRKMKSNYGHCQAFDNIRVY